MEFLTWRLAAYGSLIGILAALVAVILETREKRIPLRKVFWGFILALFVSVLSLAAILFGRTAVFFLNNPGAAAKDAVDAIAPNFASPNQGIIIYSLALVLCTILVWLLTRIPPLRAMEGVAVKFGAMCVFTLYQLSMGLPVILFDFGLL